MIQDFINLIYPETCCSCDNPLKRGEKIVCVKCQLSFPKTNYYLDSNNPIELKFRGKVNIEFAFSYLHFVKKGKVQKLLHLLKYKGREDVGLLFGQLFGNELLSHHFKYDLVVPVPMHKLKQTKRGYNQVDPFAMGLAYSLDIEWKSDFLLKVDNTESQTKKGRFDRFKNTEEVFIFNSNYTNKDSKHILLVDDVVTTGSTLEACARIILENNHKVSIATIAHAK